MGKQFTSDAPSLAEIRRKKKPRRESAWIVLDPDLATQIYEKEEEIEKAKARAARDGNRGKSLAEGSAVGVLEKELEDLNEKAGDLLAEFIFEDPGMKAYSDLQTANPPTKEQKELWKEAGGEGQLAHNSDEFVPRLISLCAVQPKITVEEAFELVDEWSIGEVTKLYLAAQGVCLGDTPVPLSRRSRTDTDETPNSG